MATSTERVARLRQRRLELGLVRVEVFVHPEDRLAIQRLAQRLQRNRERVKSGNSKSGE